MVVRCDQGGLGNQTYELWRRLQPEKTLVVHLPEPRGDEYSEKYHCAKDVVHANGPEVHTAVGQVFARGLDTVLTVETFYGDWWRSVNARTVMVTNPELHPRGVRFDRLALPTSWHCDRFPEARVVRHPAPVAPADRLRVRTEVKTFLHLAAPAMLDRNGTNAVLNACARMTERCELIVRSPDRPSPRGRTFSIGKVKVHWDDRRVRDWWYNYPMVADVLLLPRRYGGLCMPALEAATLGMPSLMTDLDPQRSESWPGWRCATRGYTRAAMKGGVFPVHSVDESDLGDLMSSLVRGEHDVEKQSVYSLVHAAAQDWSQVEEDWARLCG